MKAGGFDGYENGPAAVSCEPLHLFPSVASLWGKIRLSAQPLCKQEQKVNVEETLQQFQYWMKDKYTV